MTAISYHGTVNDLCDPVYWGDGPFSRRAWFELLEKAGHKPLMAVAKHDTGAVCLPLEWRGDQLASLCNWYAFTWAPTKLAKEPLAAMAADLASMARRIELCKLPDDDGTAAIVRDAFRSAGWFVQRSGGDVNHVLRLKGRSYAQYLEVRPGPLRTTLKRKAAKVNVSLTSAFDARDWAAYEDIYADSWKPEEGDPDMLLAFAKMESDAGRFRFAMARVDGHPVAAQFWTVDGTAAYIHKLAHRKDAVKLSPGTTLTAALMEQVIDQDSVEMVDFGTGDDTYKRDWMEEVRTRTSLICLHPKSPRNWPHIGKALLRKLVSGTRDG